MQTKTKLATKQKVAIAVGGIAVAAAMVAAGLSGFNLKSGGKGGNPPASAPKTIVPSKKIIPGVRIIPPKSLPKPIVRPIPKK